VNGLVHEVLKRHDEKRAQFTLGAVCRIQPAFFNQSAEEIRKFDFVEMMVCAGGCIGGGGQPIPVSSALVKARSGILYSLDEISHQKKAHENHTLQTIYREFLKQPGTEKAKEILHIS